MLLHAPSAVVNILYSQILNASPCHVTFPFNLTENCFTRVDYLAAVYAEMRQLEKSQQDASSTYTTPRTLLSIIRLAMSLTKLRFDTEVRFIRSCGGRAREGLLMNII